MNELAILEDFFFSRIRRAPNRPAIFDYHNNIRYTYLDLHLRAQQLARFLLEQGVRLGDRVGILAPNDMVYADLYYAFPYTGVITTSYNLRMDTKELTFLIHNESPKIIFYSVEFAPRLPDIQAIWPACRYIQLEDDSTSDFTYSAIFTAYPSGPLPCQPLGMESIVQLLHTGGTTGRPKAAMIPFRQIYFNAVGQQNAWGLNSHDCTVAFLPMFHTGTWNTVVTPMLYAGGQVVLLRHFHVEEMFQIIPQEVVTILWGVPVIYRRMMEHPDFDQADLSSLIRCRCGAAPPEPDLLERYWEKGVCFCNGYGMTETSPGCLSMPADAMSIADIQSKHTSCGRLMSYNQAKIIDDAGQAVPTGQCGELLFRGNLLFTGYWNNPEETALALVDGWFHTGDIAQVDEEGFYYIVGRKKNMYISCGENIYPDEIARTLMCHPAVEEAYVFGVPDSHMGEVGKALVVLRSGYALTASNLLEDLKHKLSTIKCPAYVLFVDSIPKNAVGKVDAPEIHRQYGSTGV